MIEKSVFQKRINSSIRQPKQDDNQKIPIIKISQVFRDVSNSVLSPSKSNTSVDYKALYEQELTMNEELTQKINLLKQKIILLQTENKELKQKYLQSKQATVNPISQKYISLPKKSHQKIYLQEIRSFKGILPNSMKVIEFEELQNFDSSNLLPDKEIISKKIVTSIKALGQGESSGVKLSESKSQKSIYNSTASLKLIKDDSLIDCLAMYGLSQEAKIDQQQDEAYYEGELTYCSKNPHQIVKHSSKLVFPNKIKKSDVTFYNDEDSISEAVTLITQTLKQEDIKAFTLIFQPASFPSQNEQNQKLYANKDVEIIDLINKEKRFYAISIAFQDFDVVQTSVKQRFANISFQDSIEENIYSFNIKQIQSQEKKMKPLSNQSANIAPSLELSPKIDSQNEENLGIRISRKVITFFTKYPFVHFFEELLIHCVKESFEIRKNYMKKNIADLKGFDHTKTIEFLKTFYQNLNQKYHLNKKFDSKINEIFEIQFLSTRLNRYETLSLELSKSLIKNFYSEIWAYPVMRLFTLDNFLDVFTLVMLQEKIIFVCENESILTSAIFLFTKVFMKPFEYPYPVVSIIPNQYDYFNAPFPIVYGCLNSKQNLVREKIPKIYKNVYIILTPSGVEILANKNATKIQARKSPQLRDKLLPYFLKMESQQRAWNVQKAPPAPRFSGFGSILSFGTSIISNQQSSTTKKFNFSNSNRQLIHQIIEKVHVYLSGIMVQIPSKQKVNEIRTQIQHQIQQKNTLQSQNIDIDKETYQRVKNKMLSKTLDPFVQKFLDTQLVGLKILR